MEQLIADHGRRVSIEELNTTKLLAHATQQAIKRKYDDMLIIDLPRQKEMESDLCWGYNRGLTEKVLPESDGRLFSALCLPFSDPDESLRQVETFGDRPGVTGFMVTTVRTLPVHDNAYMK